MKLSELLSITINPFHIAARMMAVTKLTLFLSLFNGIVTSFEIPDELVVPECPLECECHYITVYTVSVYCNNTFIPKNLPTETAHLMISSTSIDSLDDLQTVALPLLEWLAVENSQIASINFTMLYKFSHLNALALTKSPLSEFHLGHFVSVLTISSIDFRYNAIEKVTISNGPSKLMYLDLSHNNISELIVITNAVKNMIDLEWIDLSNNHIQCDCSLWRNVTEIGKPSITGTCIKASNDIIYPLFYPEYNRWCKDTLLVDSNQHNCKKGSLAFPNFDKYEATTKICNETTASSNYAEHVTTTKLYLFVMILIKTVIMCLV